jgi:hypothetical protein
MFSPPIFAEFYILANMCVENLKKNYFPPTLDLTKKNDLFQSFFASLQILSNCWRYSSQKPIFDVNTVDVSTPSFLSFYLREMIILIQN